MKKNLILIALAVVGIALVVSSCKKEESTVSFVVSSEEYADENPSKLYIDGSNYSCWESGDAVYILYGKNKGGNYSISVDGTTYSINGVTENTAQGGVTAYAALYPSGIRNYGEIDKKKPQATFNVTIPSSQTYSAGSNGQKVNAPLCAYTSVSDARFHFKNVCGLLKVNVATTNGKTLNSIVVNGSNLAGTGDLTMSASDPTFSLSSGRASSVTLSSINKVISSPTSFYIVIAPNASITSLTFNWNGGSQTSSAASAKTMVRNTIKYVNVPDWFIGGTRPASKSVGAADGIVFE